MIYATKKIILEQDEKEFDSLEDAIKTNEVNILFGEMTDFIEESIKIPEKSNKQLFVLIRNRIMDGDNGKPIPHPTITVKLCRKSIYVGPDGKKGLPFEIDPEIKLYKEVNNNANKKLLQQNKNDLKYLKKIVNDNFDDIKLYWNANPYTKDGMILINSIRNKIAEKYGLNIMEI